MFLTSGFFKQPPKNEINAFFLLFFSGNFCIDSNEKKFTEGPEDTFILS